LKVLAMRSLLLLLSAVLVLTACIERGGPIGRLAPAAQDLGSSSRIPHTAGRAGEGEGYDTVQQPVIAPTPASLPAVDHSKMHHGGAMAAPEDQP
jgi:hypothetical protein